MGHPRSPFVVVAALGFVLAGCAVDPGVRTTASERSTDASPAIDVPTTDPNADAPTTDPTTTATSSASITTTSSTAPPFEPSVTNIDFGFCDDYVLFDQEPPSGRWECGTLVVPMNHDESGGATVELAVTRLAGSRSRGATLVVNPGGPGGAGLPFVWALAEALPDDIRRLYDIVSWDPRGVGASEPAITCPRGSRWADPRLLDHCAESTGDLMSFMSTPNHVNDLEALRIAFGQEHLDYLGYSYGTYLGAMYADRFPDNVGRFVLDGAIDPASGTESAPRTGGDPWYAADDSTVVEQRFFDLCDAAVACDFGADSATSYRVLLSEIGDLPTASYPGEDIIDAVTLEAVLASSMYDPFNWGLLATALEDAADGDASAIDALADILEVSNAYFGEVLDVRTSNETIANLTIYCADFEANPSRPATCEGIPDNDDTPGGVRSVDVDTPILVIGTAFDPSTPGSHAQRLADRLDDAVELYWDGVGHTAFPFNSPCIDDIVQAYLLDGIVPDDATRCEFVDGYANDTDLGAYLFELPPFYVEPWLEAELESNWAGDAPCMARRLSGAGDRIVSHVVLGVASFEANAAVEKAAISCEDRS